MDHNNLLRQLETLRLNYIETLPKRLGDIATKWQQLNDCWQKTTVEELKKMCHTLAGGATTFGFPKITEQARQIEQLMVGVETQNSPNEQKCSEIDNLIKQLMTEPITAMPPTNESMPRQPITLLSQRPIYIVDNNIDLSQQLKTHLTPLVDEVKVFNNLHEFELELEKQEPGIILMDMMVANDQLSFTKKISELKANQLLKSSLFFMSDREDLACRLEAFRAGGNAFFAKPIDIPLLSEQISLLLQKEVSDPYRILLVDDDQLLVQHYAAIFQSVGCIVKAISKPMEIMEHLIELKPDILLLDVHMPDCNGIELAGTLRQQDAYAHLPIIFLSREIDIHKQFSAREVGGDDFLVKPIDEKYLVSSVLNRAQRTRQMHELIDKDSMTGLLNHDRLEGELERQIHIANRSQQPLVFVLFDLDHFKQVNDCYGHLAGDKVIKAFANLMISRQRQSDISGRYGGEEFAMILPETSSDNVDGLLNEIRASFASIVHHHNDKTFSVTVSIGAAKYTESLSAKQLMENADKQLYQAKNAGRNKVSIEKA